jgi:hypothetical protein
MIVGIGSATKGIYDFSKFSAPVPVKYFGAMRYAGFGICDTKKSAKKIAERIREMRYLARVTKYETPKLGYVIWVSESSKYYA